MLIYLEYLEKYYLISYLIKIYLIKLVMASENEDAGKFNPRPSWKKVSMLSSLEFYKEDDRMGVLMYNSALKDFIFWSFKWTVQSQRSSASVSRCDEALLLRTEAFPPPEGHALIVIPYIASLAGTDEIIRVLIDGKEDMHEVGGERREYSK